MSSLPSAARRFCERFEVGVPVVNAPMAFVAGGALAAAVTAAGGLGLIGGGYGDVAWIEEQRRVADDRRVGVGLIAWSAAERRGLVERLLQNGVRTLFLSFGDPSTFIACAHDAGALVACQVQSAAEASRAAAAGADAIAAQGNEAGGHGRDNEPVMELAATVIAAVAPVPVLLAGGAVDGADLAAAWRIGAVGVVIGTRFAATDEALGADAAKQRLVAATDGSTLRTTVFDLVRGPSWPTGFTGRALRNTLTDRWHGNEEGLRRSLQQVRADYLRATAAGDAETGVVWAGTGVGRVCAVQPAARVVESLMAGALTEWRRATARPPAGLDGQARGR
jgi:nitronate monooxygenase